MEPSVNEWGLPYYLRKYHQNIKQIVESMLVNFKGLKFKWGGPYKLKTENS